eukprot:CAMPEP_0204431430 /NCGR_PEP_ID=MMETSP0470-20130426/64890_1 /ASSEMBLY_ACC=CAM_ASM_000385 /TAXON_ID=2969 /ORGANISM="Oxyrrhis marina" /LENGTH=192 /DNA_ID=CAMNT_0051429633 /DNA_START=37 /DNA_END=612 /DNA_ORIENTATION=+
MAKSGRRGLPLPLLPPAVHLVDLHAQLLAEQGREEGRGAGCGEEDHNLMGVLVLLHLLEEHVEEAGENHQGWDNHHLLVHLLRCRGLCILHAVHESVRRGAHPSAHVLYPLGHRRRQQEVPPLLREVIQDGPEGLLEPQLQQAVALIQHQEAGLVHQAAEEEGALQMVQEPARSGHNDLRPPLLEECLVTFA